MLALYFIAALILLVWGTIFVLRGSLIGGCLALLIVGACFGYYFLHFSLGPVPLTLDRLVLAALAVAYVVQRRLGRTRPEPLARVDLAPVGLLAVLILSGSMVGWDNGGWKDASPLFRLLGGYVAPLAVYWIARQSPLDRSKIGLIHGVLACLGIYLAVTAVLEITGQWWAVFPQHIADPAVGLHFGRARGPMVHSVSFGLHLGICLLALWVWQQRFGRAGRLALVALVPLLLAGIYLSYTRSVWMGAGLGLSVVLALTLRGYWRPLVLGGMCAAALLLAATRMEQLLSFQREYSAAETRQSADLRASFAYVSWEMFLDRPLCGVGFGQFPHAKLPYLADRSTELNLEATRPYVHHNYFLSLLTETGLVGLGLFLAMLIGWGRSALTLVRDPQSPDWARAHGALLLGALGVYVCQALFHELSYSPIDNSLLFFLAGVTVGLRRVAGAERSDAPAQQIGALAGASLRSVPATLCSLPPTQKIPREVLR